MPSLLLKKQQYKCKLYLEYFHWFTLTSDSPFWWWGKVIISICSLQIHQNKKNRPNLTSQKTGAASLLLLDGLFILYYCLILAFNRISFYSKLYTITDFKLSQISQLKRQIQYAGNLFCFWFLLFIYLFFTVVACIEMHPFVQWRPCSLGTMWTKEHILYQIR